MNFRFDFRSVFGNAFPLYIRVCWYIILDNRLRNNFSTWEHPYRHTHRHTHTDILTYMGNNNEIKYSKDITANKNNSLLGLSDAIRCFCIMNWRGKWKYNHYGLFKPHTPWWFVFVVSFISPYHYDYVYPVYMFEYKNINYWYFFMLKKFVNC